MAVPVCDFDASRLPSFMYLLLGQALATLRLNTWVSHRLSYTADHLDSGYQPSLGTLPTTSTQCNRDISIMTPHSIGSSPQGGELSASSISRQAKRAACDRCRGQKLRCVREDQDRTSSSGKCIRCTTADATCSFSASKRAGRPPTSGATSNLERRGIGNISPGRSGSTSVMANKIRQTGFDERRQDDRFRCRLGENGDEIPLEGTLAGRERGVEMGHATIAGEHIAGSSNPSSMHESSNISNVEPLLFSAAYLATSNANLPWADEGITTFYDGGDPTDLEPFESEYSWPFPQTQTGTQDMEIQIPDPSPTREDRQAQDTGVDENNAILSHIRRSNLEMGLSPRLATGHTMESGSADSFESVRIHELHEKAQDREMEAPTNLGIFTPKSASLKDFVEMGDIPFDNSFSADEAQHRCMRELSDLGMDLYSQLIANGDTFGSPGLQNRFVGTVVNSSAKFLALLTSFYPLTRSTMKKSVFGASDGGGSPSEASEFGDFTMDERGQGHPWNRSVATSACQDDSKPVPADMTTILGLLTCYIRIIHLHNILYSRIYDHLTASLRKGASVPPVFPGLQVGGMPLDEFGNFQVKLLLQISTHVLGEVEMALGLPDGYRISKKSGQSLGILETSVSVQFIEMTMRENGRTGLGIGTDRVMSIKNNLACLKRLLNGSINI